MFTAALFTIAKIGKQPNYPSTGEWIKKPWYLYTMQYSSAAKYEGNFTCCEHGWTWRVLMLSGISQSEKDKCQMISCVRGI